MFCPGFSKSTIPSPTKQPDALSCSKSVMSAVTTIAGIINRRKAACYMPGDTSHCALRICVWPENGQLTKALEAEQMVGLQEGQWHHEICKYYQGITDFFGDEHSTTFPLLRHYNKPGLTLLCNLKPDAYPPKSAITAKRMPTDYTISQWEAFTFPQGQDRGPCRGQLPHSPLWHTAWQVWWPQSRVRPQTWPHWKGRSLQATCADSLPQRQLCFPEYPSNL